MLAITAAGLLNPAPAVAAGGTWGAGHYPYVDGRVCRNGVQTSPLAAWSVDGGHRAYLVQTITSDGQVDSAAPPVPAAGPAQPAATVGPGGGFAGEQDIAAVAYLLDHGGDAATLAAAVLTQTDPGALPACADAAAAQGALEQARRAAGPYQVTVAAPSGRVRPGVAGAVSATVRTQAGDPVPNAPVDFSSPDASFGNATATTDASGTARTQVTLRQGAPGTVVVTAATAVSTGLMEATVTARPTATNPTGTAVPAVYPAPATTYSGQASVAVDQSAHPVVSTALGSRLAATSKPFVPRANITGLNGHAADVTFDLLGPRPLTNRSLCTGIAPAVWKGADVHVAATANATLTGDGVAQGGALTPAAPGCYALRTTVATVDATPAVTRTAPLVVVAVVDTTVERADEQPAVLSARSPGSLTGSLKVGDTHGLAGSVKVTLVGPIRPADGNCDSGAAAWQKAPRNTVAAKVQSVDSTATNVSAAGNYDYALPAPSGVGCYLAQPALTLTGPGGDRVTVAAPDARATYVLDPSLTAAVQRTWAVTPGSVPVAVQVDGLYGLAAHVHVAMYVAAPDPDGCGRATFRGARRAGDGPDADVPAQPGVVDLTAESGPTPKQGCYAAVPELTLDANPRVRIAGTLGDPNAVLIAGVDPSTHVAPAVRHDESGTPLAFLVALGVLGGVLALVVLRVGYVAWRDREDAAGWSAPRDVDRLGLTDDELPSRV